MSNRTRFRSLHRATVACAGLLTVLGLATACSSSKKDSGGAASTGGAGSTGGAATTGSSGPAESPASTGLMKAGTLTVGMNLQFKPEMYLDADNKPAGYDVDLLNKLADGMGVKLNIVNLDFDGLIPGLQSKKFDMVSVGFTATDERKKVIDFTREYVPYTSVLAVRANDNSPAAIDTYNQKGKIITALQGSSGETLAKTTFDKATIKGFSQQNAALLEVATGRAQGSVLEDYILAQFQKSNPNQLKVAKLPKPLALGYGSWAVQKGNSALVGVLNSFLCKAQTGGTLATLYKKDFGVTDFPKMPGGC